LRAITRPGLDILAPAIATFLLSALAIWSGFKPAGWLPAYQTWTYILAGGVGGGATLMMMLAQKRTAPAVWAFTAVTALLAGYILAFSFLGNLKPSGLWGMMGAGLSLLPFAALSQLRSTGQFPKLQNIYVCGFFAFVMLALAMAFDRNYLTLSLAVTVILMAMFWRHLKLMSLQWLAGGVALWTLARLAFNLDLINLVVTPPVFNWLLPVYGGAALAFFIAHRLLRDSDGKPMLLNLLEATSIGLTVMLVSMNIRSFVASDSKLTGSYGFV
jgi:uncharacterized membrane protein